MATAKQFLDALELEGLVPAHLLDGLYDQYRAGGGAITAEALAERLVALEAITQEQANRLLLSPSDSFVQVSAESLKPKAAPKPAVDDPFASELESKSEKLGESRDAAGRRKHVKQSHKNQFESPLLLMGGGALILLVLCGIGLGVMLSLRSGDEVLNEAQAAYESGSYSQARESYERFVEDFEGSSRWGEARVALAVVRLRQLTETSGDWERALQVAQQEIPQIEDEDAFAKRRDEFASLLPKIARGLAEDAERASSDAASEDSAANADRLVSASEAALKLVGNTKYVPKSLRDQGEITAIRDVLDRVARRRAASAALGETLIAIESATAEGDIAGAYALHAEFVSSRPELRDDAALAKSLVAAVEAERQTIRFVSDEAAALTDERPSPVVASISLATPRLAGTAEADGVFIGMLRGVLYGVDASNGTLLWRRPVGERLAAVQPVSIDDDLLLLDHRHGELLRVSSADGKLRWRVAIEPPSAETALHQPVAAAGRVFVATEGGRLWSVNASTGKRIGYAEFAQPLRCPPAVDTGRRKVYLPGEQSSLYTLNAESLECVAIRYTGHAAGAVATPPVALGGRVLLLENSGLETSRLHVYSTDREGVPENEVASKRLDGVVTTPPSVTGRKVLCATPRGGIYLFELAAGSDGPPLALLASRPESSRSSATRRVLEVRGDVWIGGIGLTRAAASLADSQLVARALPDPCDGDRFIGPLKRHGRLVVHSRVRQGQPGFTIGASDARSGELVWETDLAAPPLGPPATSSGPRGLVVATEVGATHLIDPAAIRRGVSEKPLVAAPSAEYAARVAVGQRDAVLVQPGEAGWVRVRFGRRSGSARVDLPDKISSAPARMEGGLLTPLSIGQLLLVDAGGKQLAAPAQPTVELGQSVSWTAPTVGTFGGDTLAILSDGEETVHAVALSGADTDATLVIRSSDQLAGLRPVTPAALTAEHAVIGLEGGQLAIYEPSRLRDPRVVALPGEIAWGPYAVGDTVLVATGNDELLAINPSDGGREAWRATLDAGPLVGKPLEQGDSTVLVTTRGVIVRRDSATGRETTRVDLGQPLGAGCVANGKRLMTCAADATAIVLQLP